MQRRTCGSGFHIYLKDVWYWPADLLEDLLSVPSVDICPFSVGTGMPVFEGKLSIPNQIAWMPQIGTAYTPDMVRHGCQLFDSI